MPTCQNILCSTCGFKNNLSSQKCQICGSTLKGRDNLITTAIESNSNSVANENKHSSYINKSKATGRTRVIVSLLAVTLSIGGICLAAVITDTNDSRLSSMMNASNKNIKLYKTMEEIPNVPTGTYDYGGAICFAALQRDGMMSAIEEAHPNFKLRYVDSENNPGCTTGLQMLIDGELTIAQNSRPLRETEIEAAKIRGFELDSVPVAIDGVVFYVHKSVGVKSLTIEQIQDIYQGKVNYWQELGGANLPITPISLDPQADSILRLLMRTENAPEIDRNVIIVRDYTTAIRTAANTVGGISYASTAILRGQRSIVPIALAKDKHTPPIRGLLADGSVNLEAFRNNFYPLDRKLSIVFRRDNTPSEQAAVAYINLLLSEEGQKIIKRAGMVPLYYDW